MGYSAIAESLIRDGVSELAKLVEFTTRAKQVVKKAGRNVGRSSSTERRSLRRTGH
jgi:hypothetical protein